MAKSEYYSTTSTLGFFDRKKGNAARAFVEAYNKKEHILMKYMENEGVWFSRRASESSEDDRLSPEAEVVFMAGSALTTARLVNERRQPLQSLERRFGYDPRSLCKPGHREAHANYLLGRTAFGVTLADIFENGKQLVRQRPADVYGFTLLSAALPQDYDEATTGAHAFLPIAELPTDQLRSLCRRERFPDQMSATMLMLSNLHHQAKRDVVAGFYQPDSPHFDRIAELYEEIAQSNTPLQLRFFMADVLGVGAEDEGRYAYVKMKDHIRNGHAPELYHEMIHVIEDSYDGYLARDIVEHLGLSENGEAGYDEAAYDDIQLKKKQFLKLRSDSGGQIALADDVFGSIALKNPHLSYFKDKANTAVRLAAEIKNGGDNTIPFLFELHEKSSYSWNFLGDDKEAPGLMDAMVQAMGRALDEASLQSERMVVSEERQGAAGDKEHHRDVVYDLRKQVRDEALGNMALAESGIEVSVAPQESVGLPTEVYFPEAVASRLSPDLRAKAEVAVDRYQRGLPNIRQYKELSKGGRRVYRIKSGKMRVIVELCEGRLEVIDAGLRKTIYG